MSEDLKSSAEEQENENPESGDFESTDEFITDEKTGPQAIHKIFDLLKYCPREVKKYSLWTLI